MQTSVRRFLWAGVAALVTLVAVPVASAFGAGSVTTTFTRTSDWGSGHEVRVTITNGSDATRRSGISSCAGDRKRSRISASFRRAPASATR